VTGASLDRLYADLLADQRNREHKLPPVDKWHPPLSGDIDIRIARDGTWYHEGAPIVRKPLVKLFASILKHEDNEYYLVTPQEKWRLCVDDAPLHVIAVERQQRDQQQALVFTTLTDDTVLASAQHPLHVDVDATTGEPSPYVLVRSQLSGLISRAVYYELVEMAERKQLDGAEVFGVTSMGVFFPLS
tara:strand:+ start:4521 stop:5084 length:564 start_codon:yes stop_codon:yes gene_type:complete